MLERSAIAVTADAVAAAKDYARIDGPADDAQIAGLVAAAITQCEAFIGRMLIARAVREIIVPGAAWTRLGATPVRAVTGVAALAADGTESALAGGAYEIDLIADGSARIRFLSVPAAKRVAVTYQAGAAADWQSVAAELRQGIVRLVAHWHAYRERDEAPVPPAAVVALWRPERAVRLI